MQEPGEDWRRVVDHVVEARLGSDPLIFRERARFAQLAFAALPSLPRERSARDLFRSVVEHDLGIVDGVSIDAGGGVDPPDLFTVSRRAFLSLDEALDAHAVSLATCLALHRGERREAADGLFALASVGVSGRPHDDDLARFFRQGLAHLSALLSCFPDAAAERTLRLAELVAERGS